MESDLYFLMLNKNTELIHNKGAEADEFQVCSTEFFRSMVGKKPLLYHKAHVKADW